MKIIRYESFDKIEESKDYKNLEFNGYKYYNFEYGVVFFQKKEENGKYAVIACSEKQLTNGDIEFMSEHNFTLNDTEIKKIQNKYKKASK